MCDKDMPQIGCFTKDHTHTCVASVGAGGSMCMFVYTGENSELEMKGPYAMPIALVSAFLV